MSVTGIHFRKCSLLTDLQFLLWIWLKFRLLVHNLSSALFVSSLDWLRNLEKSDLLICIAKSVFSLLVCVFLDFSLMYWRIAIHVKLFD